LKIFLDTNIFLNLLLKRDGYKEAIMILNACSQNIFQGFICDITLLNIDYIASKQVKNIRNFLKIVNETFTIVGLDNLMLEKALDIDSNDLEDNAQYICAKENSCHLIVSDDRAFYKGDIIVLSSKDFVKTYM
jgi:predicted nucleic acid-binding protein